MADASILGGDGGRGGYGFDVIANAEALEGDNAIYRTAGAGGLAGNVTFNPDLSTFAVTPNVIVNGLNSIQPSTWAIIIAIAAAAYFLGRRK